MEALLSGEGVGYLYLLETALGKVIAKSNLEYIITTLQS